MPMINMAITTGTTGYAAHEGWSDGTTSHSTRLSKDDNQVAGYRLSAEELLAVHPKDNSQVHPQGVRRGCKGLKPQQHTQAGYDGTTDRAISPAPTWLNKVCNE